MNIPELIKYKPKLAFKMDAVCKILTEDGYPADKVYETAVAILSEIS